MMTTNPFSGDESSSRQEEERKVTLPPKKASGVFWAIAICLAILAVIFAVAYYSKATIEQENGYSCGKYHAKTGIVLLDDLKKFANTEDGKATDLDCLNAMIGGTPKKIDLWTCKCGKSKE
jgi:hypothetical protein